LSLSELARRSGLGKATMSQLESGQRNPTLETLFAITTALEVPLGALLDVAEHGRASGEAVDALLVDRYTTTHQVGETYRLTIRPARQVSGPHLPGTKETLVVLDGRIRTGPLNNPVELSIGETFTFHADSPHTYQSMGETATCLLVMTFLTATTEPK